MRRQRIIAALFLALASKAGAQDASPEGTTLRRFDQLFKMASGPPKNEFETTVAFSERVRAQLDSSVVAIEIDTTARYVSYNADKAKFTISTRFERVLGQTYSEARAAVRVHNLAKVVGEHEASNAFGARTTVTDETSDRWVVASHALAQGMLYGFDISVPASPDSARLLKPFLRVYAVGRCSPGPQGSAASSDHLTDPATMDLPISLSIARKILWMDTVELVVTDARSGSVLARWPMR